MSEINVKNNIKSKTNSQNNNKCNNNKTFNNKSKTNGNQRPKDIEIITLPSDEDSVDHSLSDTEVEEEVTDDEEEEEFLQQLLRSPKKSTKMSAKFCGSVKSNHEKPLYGVVFNTYLPEDHNYFATVGSNRVTIYECLSNGSIRLVDCYADPNPSEDLYSCCWSYDDSSSNPLVIIGGKLSVIRVIDCGLKTNRYLRGHGSDINDLKVSPYDHNLLLSSSKDYSLRLWNIKSSICVIKFGGDSGHRDQVICADFYLLSDKYIVSTGMDHSIKIWSLDYKNVRNAIKESYEWQSEDQSFPLQWQHYPVFNTRQIHSNYIDCIQFFGNFLLSKSCDNEIVCSKPTLLDTKTGFPKNGINSEIEIIDRFKLFETTFWFIKFSMNSEKTLLSVGNNCGITYVWDMSVPNPLEYEPLALERPKCRSTIRQTSFSTDGSILICVCDDSSIWRWNITRNIIK